ncbi:MAG: hypothetical protein ACTHN0_07030, partial [Aquihabitans sp.]
MTSHRSRATWPPSAHDPGWGPPPPPPRPDLPPPPDPGWERAAPPLPPPGWVHPQARPGLPIPPSPPTEWPAGPPPQGPIGPSGPASTPAVPPRPPVDLQNLLLGLGTALVAISVVVFTAVNWSQLDASLQGLILVALTVVAGAAAVLAGRRDMPATAEAVGVVSVLMALADVHAVRVGLAPAADPALFWAGGFAVVAVLAQWLGAGAGIRGPRVAAGLLVQLPVPCLLVAAETTVWQGQLALVAQAFVVVALADRFDVGRWVRRVASAWALAAAALLTEATVAYKLLGQLLTDTDVDPH